MLREFDGETVDRVALDAPEWNLPPDGPPAAPAVLNPAFPNTPAHAIVQSSGTGQYLIPIPQAHWFRYIPKNRLPGSKGLREYEFREPTEKTIPALDLKTLQPIGSYPNAAPYWCGGFLAPDSKHIVGPDNDVHQLRTLEEGKLFVWAIDKPEPERTIELRGVVLWADFTSPREFAAVTFDEERKPDPEDPVRPKVVKRTWTFWLFDIVDGRQLHKTDLAEGDVCDRFGWEHKKKPNAESYEFDFGDETESSQGTEKPNVLYFVPEPLLGSVSPGGKRIYIGGKKGVTVLGVPEGRVLARLPIATPNALARDEYYGFAFSKDGTELRTVCLASPSPKPGVFEHRSRYVLCWDLRTGKGTHATALKDQELAGPPVDGPTDETFTLGMRRTYEFSKVVHRKLIGWTPPFMTERRGAIVARSNGKIIAPLDYPSVGRFEAGVHLRLLPQGLPSGPVGVGFPKPMSSEPMIQYVKLATAPTVVSPWEQFVAANPRPALAVADRKAVVKVPAVVAGDWAVPAAKEKLIASLEPACELAGWPTVWTDAHAGDVRVVGQPMVGAVHRVVWVKHDLKTGRAAEPIALWPWVTQKEKSTARFRPPLAAATRAGDKIALRDPNDESRLDLFDSEGKRLVGFQPHAGMVDWLAWCGPDRLLTKSHDIVVGWEMPACKALFELTDCATEPLVAPSGGWLARVGAARVDFVDAATGRGLGSIATPNAGAWTHTSISPDGQRLVRAATGDHKKLGVADSGLGSRLHAWDLATGKEKSIASVPVAIDARAAWVSPRRLVAMNSLSINRGNGWEKTSCDVIDLDLGIVVGSFGPPKGHSEPNDPTRAALRVDPLGRWWAARAGGQSLAGYRPAKFEFLQVPDVGPTGYPFRPGAPVRAKVELEGHAKPAAERVAAALQRFGFDLAPNGWLLQATARVVDTSVTLTFSANDPKGEAVPKIVLDWKLIDPNGKEAWTDRTEYPWVSGSSRYFSGRDHSRGGMANQTMITVTHFDFKGKVVRDAILEEIASQIGQTIVPPEDLPRGVFDAGTYRPLPVRGEYLVLDPAKK